MPIVNITHGACLYTVELGIRPQDLARITLDNNYTAYICIFLQ